MQTLTTKSIQDFYLDVFGKCCPEVEAYLNESNGQHIGHFNVFSIADLLKTCSDKAEMPYDRRTYYKISLINGRNRVEYATRTVEVKDYALLFSTPKIPYRYYPLDQDQNGHFCVFTKDFVTRTNSGIILEDWPLFQPSSAFIYELTADQFEDASHIFRKMKSEIKSDYPFKYDLLRNYVVELLHFGQKLEPYVSVDSTINASSRITTLFIDLLERQFPIESAQQNLRLRTAKDYADTLKVHVNHLNKVLKQTTSKTTTEIISSRITQEAKTLLKQTNWTVSEIAWSLGFDEVAHFSNFFKKQTQVSPLTFRS